MGARLYANYFGEKPARQHRYVRRGILPGGGADYTSEVISVTDEKAADVLSALRNKHRAIMETWSDLAHDHGEIVKALDRALEALGHGNNQI